MKKIIPYQWLALVFSMCIITSCSKKNYPSNNTAAGDEQQYEISKNAVAGDYTPPQVITIPDDRAKSNKEGELYYDNEYGYRYWRNSDGKYYLDAKYEKDKASGKKIAKKKYRQTQKEKAESNVTDKLTTQ